MLRSDLAAGLKSPQQPRCETKTKMPPCPPLSPHLLLRSSGSTAPSALPAASGAALAAAAIRLRPPLAHETGLTRGADEPLSAKRA